MSSAAVPNGPKRTEVWLKPVIAVGLVALALIAAIFLRSGGSEETTGDGPMTTRTSPAEPTAQETGTAPSSGAVDSGQESPAPTPSETEEYRVEEELYATRDADDPLGFGPVDAPVVMTVFTDNQCTYCAKWGHETLPMVWERVERGELRLEWRDVNIYGEPSAKGARASYAAALQGKFKEFHEHLFPDGRHRSADQLTEDALIGYAREAGLDVDRFTSDLRSDEAHTAVARNEQLGNELGVYSTPSFIIGGIPIVGAQPTEVFENVVGVALSEA